MLGDTKHLEIGIFFVFFGFLFFRYQKSMNKTDFIKKEHLIKIDRFYDAKVYRIRHTYKILVFFGIYSIVEYLYQFL